jgi:hypothetical protein
MTLLDIAKPLIDRGTKLTTTVVGTAAGQAGALVNRIQNRSPDPKPLNDPTLKTKVESTIFRLPGVSKGKVDVTVADGVVTLHGEVRNQAQMTSLQNAVRAIPEVKDVESELHLPKTPAPSTPNAGQRKQTRPRAAARPAARSERFNRDKTGSTSAAEPKPTELAAERKGRQPAPMGSKDTATGTAKATPKATAKPVSKPSAKPAEAPKTAAGTVAANEASGDQPKPQADSPVSEVAGTGATKES